MQWKLLCSLLVVGIMGCVADPDPEKPVTPEGKNPYDEGDGFADLPDEVYVVQFVTTQGDITIEVHSQWAPEGAKQFRKLVEAGFFQDCRFFRVVGGFMAQFGINGDPAMNKKFDENIPSDVPRQTNARGMVTFAMAGSPDTRSTQLFINYGDNSFLDGQGFAPIGKVIEGMSVVDELYSDYGDAPPSGRGPDQGRIQSEGNAYLVKEYPNLDYIKEVKIIGVRTVEGKTPPTEPAGESTEATTPAEPAASSTEPATQPN